MYTLVVCKDKIEDEEESSGILLSMSFNLIEGSWSQWMRWNQTEIKDVCIRVITKRQCLFNVMAALYIARLIPMLVTNVYDIVNVTNSNDNSQWQQGRHFDHFLWQINIFWILNLMYIVAYRVL